MTSLTDETEVAPKYPRATGGSTLVTVKVKSRSILLVCLPEMGHMNPMLNIAKELSSRGHAVYMATCKFLAAKIERSCTENNINFVGIADGLQSGDTVGSPANIAKQSSLISMYKCYNEAMLDSLTKEARAIKPEVILTDFFTTCGFDVGAALGIPVAVNFADPVAIGMLGASPPSCFPAVASVMLPIVMPGVKFKDLPFLYKTFSYLREAVYNKFCFVNSFWGLEQVRPVPPNVMYTGPTTTLSTEVLEQTSMESLNEWLLWARAEKLSVVYVTFGTMVQLSPEQIRGLYEGMSEIPGVAVAWSLKEAGQKSLPASMSSTGPLPASLPGKKFFVHHWFPQADVLRLRDVKAVITHCGFGGLMEIIVGGKPLIGMPFMGDQFSNAESARKAGMGEYVPASQISKDVVQKLVSKVMQNDSYRVNATRMQAAIMASGGAVQISTHLELLAEHGNGHMSRELPTLTKMAWCCS